MSWYGRQATDGGEPVIERCRLRLVFAGKGQDARAYFGDADDADFGLHQVNAVCPTLYLRVYFS